MPHVPPTPRIVIIGGGFGGLHAALALAGAPVRVTLLDRHNYHLFQPLLYQVATAALSPADVASPIRWVLRRQRNVEVLLAHALAIDVAARTGALDRNDTMSYDYLILATAARGNPRRRVAARLRERGLPREKVAGFGNDTHRR